MVILTIKKYITELDLNDKSLDPDLKFRLKDKRELFGDDYIDEEFYKEEKVDILIDTTEGFVYEQINKDEVEMRRLLAKEIFDSISDDEFSDRDKVNVISYEDKFIFNGDVKDLYEKLLKQYNLKK